MSDETYWSARYRRLAREALGAANTLPPGVSRDTLLQMAQVWERLAEQHADNTGPLSSTGRADQPAMQQQQQVQPDDEDEK